MENTHGTHMQNLWCQTSLHESKFCAAVKLRCFISFFMSAPSQWIHWSWDWKVKRVPRAHTCFGAGKLCATRVSLLPLPGVMSEPRPLGSSQKGKRGRGNPQQGNSHKDSSPHASGRVSPRVRCALRNRFWQGTLQERRCSFFRRHLIKTMHQTN